MTVTVRGVVPPVPVPITGIHLYKVGGHVVVCAEIEGTWVEVIREREDGSYSHIVEAEGMRSAARGMLGLEK
jgi:hypothetical protein